MKFLYTPDAPGWWAFEGSEWEDERVVCEEVDPEKEGRFWDEDKEEYIPYKYREVKGKPFKTVLMVRYSLPMETVSAKNSHGPHRGEQFLGYLNTHHPWDTALHTLDQLTGKWYRLALPWEEA